MILANFWTKAWQFILKVWNILKTVATFILSYWSVIVCVMLFFMIIYILLYSIGSIKNIVRHRKSLEIQSSYELARFSKPPMNNSRRETEGIVHEVEI